MGRGSSPLARQSLSAPARTAREHRPTSPAEKQLLFIGLAVLAATALVSAAGTNILVRQFDIVPGAAEIIGTEDADWKKAFSLRGTEWPEGSSIQYIAMSNKVVVANTPENIVVIEDILSCRDCVPNQVEIEAHFVAYNPADIATIAMASPTGIVDKASLFELRRQGKAELLFAPKVVTQSGAEATVKAVTEYRYPTEHMGKVPTTVHTNSAGKAMYPEDFEIREVGICLCLLPEVAGEGDMITITLAPESVYGGRWEDYGPAAHGPKGNNARSRMRQPLFHTQSVATTVNVYDGETVVIAGGMIDREGTKTVYIFITARLIDPTGKPVPSR